MVAIEIKALNALRRRRVWLAWHKEIQPDFWSTSTARSVYKEISVRYESAPKTLRLIPMRQLEDWAETHFGRDATKTKHIELLVRMRRVGYDPKQDDVATFLQRRGFESALNQGIELLDSPEGMGKLGTVRDRIDALVKLRSESATKAHSFFNTTKTRTVPIRKGVISVGFSSQLDAGLGGGLGEGELGIFLGATNRGKTAMLCNIGAQAMKQGHGVVYFTLDDLGWKWIARRVDQILLGWTEEQIVSKPKTYKRLIAEMREPCGDLFLYDFNDRMSTVLDIRAAVESLLEKGKSFDMVCIDYMDVLESFDGRGDERKTFLQACRMLRRMGKELGLTVWTASQGNRQSLEAEEIKLSQMAGTIVKAKAGDVVIGMNQTEDERRESLMRVQVLKSRVSAVPDSPVWLATDWSTMRIEGAEHD